MLTFYWFEIKLESNNQLSVNILIEQRSKYGCPNSEVWHTAPSIVGSGNMIFN